MSKDHQLHDKTFQPFISEAEIQANVQKLALSLEKDYEGKELLFIAILNGAFMFASDLMKKFNKEIFA
jgi:hypoxanthine-guanine phosphoribosyltransferase